jgi:hypothetical protein
MKTSFQSLFYLRKALSILKIKHQEQELTTSDLSQINLVIPQSNGYDIEFCWKGEHYELVVDRSFWQQSYPIETFIERISQKYAGEVVLGESQKMGFQPVEYQKNLDGSTTMVLERWSN